MLCKLDPQILNIENLFIEMGIIKNQVNPGDLLVPSFCLNSQKIQSHVPLKKKKKALDVLF